MKEKLRKRASKTMIKKILSILLGVVVFTVALIVFVFLLIPLDSVATYLEHEVSAGKVIELSIGETERSGAGTFIFREIEIGIDLSKLEKTSASKKAEKGKGKAVKGKLDPKDTSPKGEADKAKDAPPEVDTAQDKDSIKGSVLIDELEISVDPFDLLSPKAVSVEFRMDLLGGEIGDAEVWFSDSVGMSRPRLSALLPNLSTNALTGSIESGSVLFEPSLDDEDDSAEGKEGEDPKTKKKKGHYTGEISLQISQLVAKRPLLTIKYKKGPGASMHEDFQLTDLKLGDCGFEIKIDKASEIKSLSRKARKKGGTVLLFEKGECSGESIDYAIRKDSYIQMPKKGGFSKATMNIWTKMAFSSDYFKEKLKVDGQVISDNDKLDKAIRFQQRGWERSRDVDGYYWMHCHGSMTKSKCKRLLPPEEKHRKTAEKEREKAVKKAEKAKAAKSKVKDLSTKKAAPKEKKAKVRKERPARPRPAKIRPSRPKIKVPSVKKDEEDGDDEPEDDDELLDDDEGDDEGEGDDDDEGDDEFEDDEELEDDEGDDELEGDDDEDQPEDELEAGQDGEEEGDEPEHEVGEDEEGN
jgi:hypothetical protein